MATTNFVDGTTIVVADWLNDVDAHAYNQQTAAHSAANISFSPVGTIAATDVQTAIAEVATDAAAEVSALTAADIAFTPVGTVVATDVQAAIAEVAGETVQKTGDAGSAKMPAGTTAQRDITPAAGWTRFNSTLGCSETYNGTEWEPVARQESTVVATTSGTSHSITGIPAYAAEVKLHFVQVSVTGTATWLIQAGVAAGLTTSGYTIGGFADYSGPTVGTSTAGAPVRSSSAATTYTGTITFSKQPGSDTWLISGSLSRGSGEDVRTMALITLAGPLDRVGISRGGADTFDLGSIWATWS